MSGATLHLSACVTYLIKFDLHGVH